MRKWFSGLNNSIKIAVIIYLVGLLGLLFLSPFFFFNLMDIPLGVLLGGVVIGSLYLLSALAEKSDEKKGNATLTIIVMSSRFFIIAGIMVLITLMSYRWGMRIFNPFAFIGVYTVSIIINVIVLLRERNK